MSTKGGKRKAAAIFIAMPVFRGEAHLRETLECVRAQSFGDYRVLMSVDGRDERSAALCAEFTGDPRFEMVIQPAQLGFKGNLNWLIERADGRYFCYWQQDDLAHPTYLQVLHDWAESHPAASCTYCDLEWLGSRSGRTEHASVLGSIRERLQQALEGYQWVAIRGLVRAEALHRTGPWPVIALNGDYLWTVKLAEAGELHRVPGALYYKRAHAASASAGSQTRVVGVSRWRDVIVFARHLFEVLGPLATSVPGRWQTAGQVVARMLSPAAVPLFATAGFSATVRRRLLLDLADEIALPERTGPGPRNEAVPIRESGAVEHDVATVRQWRAARQAALRELVDAGRLTLDLSAASGHQWLLREGWSELEPWGVWSTGDFCRMVISLPARWKAAQVTFDLRAYVPPGGQAREVFVQAGDGEEQALRFDSGAPQQVSLDVPGRARIELRFRTPGSISPLEAGSHGDARRLGIALERLEVRKPPAIVGR